MTLHLKDVKCNEATVATISVGHEELAPALTILPEYPTSVGCVNDNPSSTQYGPAVLDNDLHIAALLEQTDVMPEPECCGSVMT